MLTKSGDEGGNLGIQTAGWVHTYRDKPGRPSLFSTYLPRRTNPEAGCRESLNWMLRWGERDHDAQVRALGAWDTGLRLSWSRNTQLCSRNPSPPQSAFSFLDATVDGASLCGAASGVYKVRLCALRQSRWGLLGGKVKGGESLCGGGEGCWFLTPSQPVQDTLVSRR